MRVSGWEYICIFLNFEINKEHKKLCVRECEREARWINKSGNSTTCRLLINDYLAVRRHGDTRVDNAPLITTRRWENVQTRDTKGKWKGTMRHGEIEGGE